MAAATNQQMQQFADQRIRVRAEQVRTLVAALRDDKAAMDSVYERANTGAAWADARTDGPPKLLGSQDVLTYNAIVSLLLKCVDGTASVQDVADLHTNFAPFQAACVRAVGA